METKLVKLINGEEFISNVSVENNIVRFSSPLRLVPAEGGLMFVPFVYFAEKAEICIRLDHILFMTEVDSRILAKYKEQTTGLVLPQQGLIT
jgi:hypothetical protein